MTAPLATAWSISFIIEAALMIRVWTKLRKMYTSFFLYLLADITAALFLIGVVVVVPWDYPVAWITLELVMVGFQFAIAIEAIRRANTLLMFQPRNLLLVLLSAMVGTAICWWLLRSPNPWPSTWLVPVNCVRATIEMFLGLGALFLVTLPGRASCLMKFQGRHLVILSIYLIVSALLLFVENHLYTHNSSIPGAVFMFVTAGFFAAWTLAIPRKAVAD